MMYTSIRDKFVVNYMAIHVFFSLLTRITVNYPRISHKLFCYDVYFNS